MPTQKSIRLVLVAILIIIGMAGLVARDFSSLQTEIWIDSEPMGDSGPRPDISRDESITAMVEEARVLFSGMIYGFEFVFRPADLARNVEEKFSIVPISMIPWGDSGFEFRETRTDNASIYLRIRYFPSVKEISRLEAWASSHLQDGAGAGFASYFEGTAARLKSITESCKDAIRACARGLVHNKPSHIQGQLIFSEVPRISVISGQFRTDTRVRIDIRSIEEYRNY